MFDGAIHRDSIMFLKYVPFRLFLIGYWAMGSTEVFGNVSDPIEYVSQEAFHKETYFGNINYTQIFILVILTLGVLRSYFGNKIS